MRPCYKKKVTLATNKRSNAWSRERFTIDDTQKNQRCYQTHKQQRQTSHETGGFNSLRNVLIVTRLSTQQILWNVDYVVMRKIFTASKMD